MAKESAGILLYRFRDNTLEVFLVHPGGPFGANKDKASWSVPKGEFADREQPLEAAKREFEEETGISVQGPFIELGSIRQPSRKVVYVWAAQGDCDPHSITSNTFEIEWPPKSGKVRQFPEIDRASWFSPAIAKEKLHKGQIGFIDRLVEELGIDAEELEGEKPSQLELLS